VLTTIYDCFAANPCFAANRYNEFLGVPFGDSFLLVTYCVTGCSERLSTIYLYNPDGDNWTQLDARLEGPKSNAVAMMVEREIFDC
jgi:hypothetical protein